VLRYYGTAWEVVGTPGFSADIVSDPTLALDAADVPYVAYTDAASDYKATVMRYNGTAWEVVGTPGFSAGYANTPSLALDAAGTPYVVYMDNEYASRVTVMRYVSSANEAPVAYPGGPYLGPVNSDIQFDGSLSSDADGDTLTYAWTFGDSGSADEATPTHSYAAAGVYDVCLTVHDGAVDSPQVCTMAVVYDPSAGFVTGGGWIDSAAGAYIPSPTLAGQATFGFVSKYNKGQSVPTGTTEFQFEVAGFSFASSTYEWLVVTQAGTNAQFKGSGTVNGGPDQNGNAYKFMIWAGDGSPDTFRIKIWWEDSGTEVVVYDNGFDQAIGAGNIVIHTK
jgi:hypothetical protein